MVLIMGGPHVKNVDSHWRIRFLHILQEVRPVCKTRNQFDSTDIEQVLNETKPVILC